MMPGLEIRKTEQTTAKRPVRIISAYLSFSCFIIYFLCVKCGFICRLRFLRTVLCICSLPYYNKEYPRKEMLRISCSYTAFRRLL